MDCLNRVGEPISKGKVVKVLEPMHDRTMASMSRSPDQGDGNPHDQGGEVVMAERTKISSSAVVKRSPW